jgi:hypothetical protein
MFNCHLCCRNPAVADDVMREDYDEDEESEPAHPAVPRTPIAVDGNGRSIRKRKHAVRFTPPKFVRPVMMDDHDSTQAAKKVKTEKSTEQKGLKRLVVAKQKPKSRAKKTLLQEEVEGARAAGRLCCMYACVCMYVCMYACIHV